VKFTLTTAQVECLALLGYLTEGGNLADAAQAFLTEALECGEHLTEAEMDKLLGALKRNRHGHRDWLIGLIVSWSARLRGLRSTLGRY
jgi:hypothetical protein